MAQNAARPDVLVSREGQARTGYFIGADGQNYTLTFFLVASLFLLWGLCNSMIDTMDKHFQDLLHLTKAQSAWVQFSHYVGYTIMALPAGLLTRRLGYKYGIIFGLAFVSLGGFWFLPATRVAEFWAFLLGVCLIAMGLTVLETVANPYTTVLGPKEHGTFRINLAQSFNGIGWITGPFIASKFFYAIGGAEAAQRTLFIPYVTIAAVVLVMILLFWRASVPEIQIQDEYHTDDASVAGGRIVHPGRNYVLIVLNTGVLAFAAYMLLKLILPASGVSAETVEQAVPWLVGVPFVAAAAFLYSTAQKLPSRSIWTHPHFSGATLAQFLYVAAQAGIFSFFINYMVAEVPAVSEGFRNSWLLANGSGAAARSGGFFINEIGASRLQSAAFFLFFLGRVVGSAILRKASAHRALGAYAIVNILLCALVIAKLSWLSVAAVFASFFFMSIMFPTIFALGIFGFGAQSKKNASAFIVMSITGGALMPKIMGYLGDVYNMSVSFLMPLGCFVFIALYAFLWPRLSQAEGLTGLSTAKGH
jgi:FHS family L-fucose permease-like MFS transporter